jgi:hypothetical protein
MDGVELEKKIGHDFAEKQMKVESDVLIYFCQTGVT